MRLKCLKPFYNKKSIVKTEYKEIMRKCVQKVCHTRSGEINPGKIRSLVEGYIKKVKYYRKKKVGPSLKSSKSEGDKGLLGDAPGAITNSTDVTAPALHPSSLPKMTGKPATPIKNKS